MNKLIYSIIIAAIIITSCEQEPVQIIEQPEKKIGFRFTDASDIFLEEGKDSVITFTILADSSIYNTETVYIEFSAPSILILDKYIESLYWSKRLYNIDYIFVDGKKRKFLKYDLSYINKSANIRLKPSYSDFYWGNNTFYFKIYNQKKPVSEEKFLYFDSLAENQMVIVHYEEKTEKPVVGIVDGSHRPEFLIFDLTTDYQFFTKTYGVYTATKSFNPIKVSLAYEGNLKKDVHYEVEAEYSENDSLVVLQGEEQKIWVTFKITDKDKVKNGDQIKLRISNVENGLIAASNDGLLDELIITIQK
jgi:hypothetical protein